MDGTQPTLHDMFEEILEEKGPESPRIRASQQLDSFFAQAPSPRNETEFGYWRNNYLSFTALAQMA